MGLFSGIKDRLRVGDVFDSFSGKKGAEATDEAARIQQEQFNKIFEMQRPIAEAGIEQLPFLQDSATAQGFSGNLGAILGAASPLTDMRSSAASSMLSRAGLGGRSAAASEAGRLTGDQTLAIENELNRRRQGIAGIGFTGMDTQAGALGASGNAQAGGILGSASMSAGRAGNTAALIGQLLQSR